MIFSDISDIGDISDISDVRNSDISDMIDIGDVGNSDYWYVHMEANVFILVIWVITHTNIIFPKRGDIFLGISRFI